ncbi:hypothetical protein RFI_39175 [Reticulomyxa filosa]|uniref:Uncharacterized protein n=1 Tax=Reticulomyxa filosa TaxID=46433 RepID=X6LAF7_RETFI|nr:hypothetical protein RFI_39175 [Reticulomyxa filosa]|eukprot:ETN98335.1 hypothetical protein RFI_39175 [Reticulomyxa filosa]
MSVKQDFTNAVNVNWRLYTDPPAAYNIKNNPTTTSITMCHPDSTSPTTCTSPTPTRYPTKQPTAQPTKRPTTPSTASPSKAPTTARPTSLPTETTSLTNDSSKKKKKRIKKKNCLISIRCWNCVVAVVYMCGYHQACTALRVSGLSSVFYGKQTDYRFNQLSTSSYVSDSRRMWSNGRGVKVYFSKRWYPQVGVWVISNGTYSLVQNRTQTTNDAPGSVSGIYGLWDHFINNNVYEPIQSRVTLRMICYSITTAWPTPSPTKVPTQITSTTTHMPTIAPTQGMNIDGRRGRGEGKKTTTTTRIHFCCCPLCLHLFSKYVLPHCKKGGLF